MPLLFSSIVLVFLFSLFLGSLANVLIYRIPREIPLGLFKQLRSFCPHCRAKVAWYDNFPVLSYFFLKGRCRVCQKKISVRYPMVELLTACVLSYSCFHMGQFLTKQGVALEGWFWGKMIMDVYFLYTLIVIVFIDIDFKIIPDRFSLGNWALALLCAVFGVGLPFVEALVGGLVGAGSFFFIAWSFEKLRGIEGLGMGDVKMMGWLGAWLGAFSLPVLVIVASFSGLFAGILAILQSRFDKTTKSQGLQTAIPFGPFLALGAYVVWWLSYSSLSLF